MSANAVRLLNEAPELQAARGELLRHRERDLNGLSQTFWETLAAIRAEAVTRGDQELAAAVWCLETIGKIQNAFVRSFRLCKENHFYNAWCELEVCEVQLSFLGRHYVHGGEEFGLPHIQRHVESLQSLFPYTMFFSPGFIVREARCSICDAILTLRSGCDHEPGEIYDGKMCGRKITRAEMLEVSMVTNPVQKYSVVFSPDIQYNYGPVKYVIDGLRSPWHAWTINQMERDDGGLHLEVTFEVPPPGELAPFVEHVQHFVEEPVLQRRKGAAADADSV